MVTTIEHSLRGKNIAYIHNVELEVDNRAQKEIVTLKRAGANVLVCAWDKNKNEDNKLYDIRLRKMNITVENICVKVTKSEGLFTNIIPLIKYQIKLFKWLRRHTNEYEYIHAVDLDVAFISSLYARIYNKKFIYDIFDDYADCHASRGSILHKVIRFIDKGIINRSSTVIICSEKRKEQLAIMPKKLVIIHNSPDIKASNNILHDYHIDKSKLNVAYVGNLFPGRMTLEMANMIAGSKNIELYCGGAGAYEDDLINLSEKYDNIHFYGRMAYESVIDMESQCDVIPALYDPKFANHRYAAPNKFYEALSLGKPTIMVKETGMADEVIIMDSGVIIDYEINSLKKALDNIHNNLKKWRSRKKELRNMFESKYSWEIMEKRLLDIYDNE